MAKRKQTTNGDVLVTVSTPQELNINEVVKSRIEKVLQEVVDSSSKEFFRTITVNTTIEIQ